MKRGVRTELVLPDPGDAPAVHGENRAAKHGTVDASRYPVAGDLDDVSATADSVAS